MATQLDTVVIVDADGAGRERLQSALQTAGYTVREAASPEEGFRFVLNDPPDVFLLCTDLDEPRANNAISEIKELSATSKVKVIVLTNSAGPPAVRSFTSEWRCAISPDWMNASAMCITNFLQLRVTPCGETTSELQTASILGPVP